MTWNEICIILLCRCFITAVDSIDKVVLEDRFEHVACQSNGKDGKLFYIKRERISTSFLNYLMLFPVAYCLVSSMYFQLLRFLISFQPLCERNQILPPLFYLEKSNKLCRFKLIYSLATAIFSYKVMQKRAR